MRHILILAGGSGTRLWPLSRHLAPKQVYPMLDTATMLQRTYARIRDAYPVACVTVATAAPYAVAVRAQLPNLPEDRLLIEPEARETAAAIAYATLRIAERDPEAVLTTVNSDAHVQDACAYLDAIACAQSAVERGHAPLVLIGIVPTYPETGYGYLELSGEAAALELVPVRRFVEKPNAEDAASYVASGRYLWNPALFTFRATHLLSLVAEHLPEHARALDVMRGQDDPETIAHAFHAMPKISIDYGIMEKVRDLVVIPAAFGWADIGSWRAVHDMFADAPNTNVVHGTSIVLEGDGNLVMAPEGKVIALYGIRGTVVVDTPDALLVCPRDRAQEVKRIVAELQRLGLSQYL